MATRTRKVFQCQSAHRIYCLGIGATDTDVIVLDRNSLFLFECKHSLPPSGPHELRDIWEEIEHGVRQLEIATTILGDPVRRQSYLAGWFPGLKAQETEDLKIVACVLCSHRIFSGLQYGGYPIRDFSSLAKLCDDGVVGMGGGFEKNEVVLRRYRVIRGDALSELDLTDYCSPDPIYFKMFKPFMQSITRIEAFKDMTLARETFVYQVELDQWSQHMETLGLPREPDRRQSLNAPDLKDHDAR